jgi:hypothetical protein
VIEALRMETPRVPNLGDDRAEWKVRWDAKDSYSPIARVEYSVDAEEWKLVYPVGRTSDSPQESYELSLRDLAAGEHTLVVRAFDQFENTASAKITFSVEPQKKK